MAGGQKWRPCWGCERFSSHKTSTIILLLPRGTLLFIALYIFNLLFSQIKSQQRRGERSRGKKGECSRPEEEEECAYRMVATEVEWLQHTLQRRCQLKPGSESHTGKPHMNISNKPNEAAAATTTKKIQRGCQPASEPASAGSDSVIYKHDE